VNVRLPCTVSRPIELPGPSAPPLITVSPTMPLPPRVPPAFTVTPLADVMSPLTLSVPPLTFIGPVKVLVPVSVQVEVPILLRVPKPWYCRRIDLRYVEAVAAGAAELQRIGSATDHIAGYCRSRRQRQGVALPANWIAKTAPVMVPELNTEEPPLKASNCTVEGARKGASIIDIDGVGSNRVPPARNAAGIDDGRGAGGVMASMPLHRAGIAHGALPPE